jgi:hypothetical protein
MLNITQKCRSFDAETGQTLEWYFYVGRVPKIIFDACSRDFVKITSETGTVTL